MRLRTRSWAYKSGRVKPLPGGEVRTLALCLACCIATACTSGRMDDRRISPVDSEPSTIPEPTAKSGALQISLSSELSTSISAALVESGLTDAQVEAVTTEVRATGVIAIDTGTAGLTASPGFGSDAERFALNLADFSLADQTAALKATAPSVAGAYVASLDAPSAGLSEEVRKNAIGIVTKATFAFAGKKVVEESSREIILGDIAGEVVEKSSEASLSGDGLVGAVGVVADAAFANMASAGVPETAIGDTAKILGTKISEGLGNSRIGTESLPIALGLAAEKASSALGHLSLPDPVAALGSTTEGFVAGLSENSSISREIRLAALSEVPKGISTAVPAWLPAEQLEEAVAQVTTSSFSTFVNKLSPSAEEISVQAPRLAEGSVAGLVRSGATSSSLAASNVTAKPFQAIVEKLDSVGLVSEQRLKVVENTLAKSISALASSLDTTKLGSVAPQLVSRAFEVATTSRAKLGIDQTEAKVTNFYDTLLDGAIGGLAKAGSSQQAGTASAASSILAKTMDAAVASLSKVYSAAGSSLSENILKAIPARAAESAGEKLSAVLPPDDLNGAFATVTTQYLYKVQPIVATKATNVDVSDLTKKVTTISLSSFSGAFNARPLDTQTAVTALNNKMGAVSSAMGAKMLAAVQGASQEVVLQAQERVSPVQACDGLTNPDDSLIVCTKPDSVACPTRATPFQGYRLSWQPDAAGIRCFLYRELLMETSAAGITCDSTSEYVYGIGCRPKVVSCSVGETFVYGVGCRSKAFFCPAGQKLTSDQGCVVDSSSSSPCLSGERMSAKGSCVAAATRCSKGMRWVASGSGGSCVATSTEPECPAGSSYSPAAGKCVMAAIASGGSSGTCGSGFYRSSGGTCRPFGSCDSGTYWDPGSTSCKGSATCVTPMVWDSVSSTCRSNINTVESRCPEGQIWKDNACSSCVEGTSWDSVAKICRTVGSCSPGFDFDPTKKICEISSTITCDNSKVKPSLPVFSQGISTNGGIQLTWAGSADVFLLVRRPTSAASVPPTDGIQYPTGGRLGAGIVIFVGRGLSFLATEPKDTSTTYSYELWAANMKCSGPIYSPSVSANAGSVAPTSISNGTATASASGSTTATVPGGASSGLPGATGQIKYLDLGSSSGTIQAGNCAPFTVRSRDAAGAEANVGATSLMVKLIVETAATTKDIFYQDTSCTTKVYFQTPATSTVQIPANQSSKIFYVKTTANDWFTVRASAEGYSEGLWHFAVSTWAPIAAIQAKSSKAVFARGSCEPILIGLANANGKPAAVTQQQLSISLSQTGSASLFTSPGCGGSAITSVSIPANTALQSLYVKVQEAEDLLLIAKAYYNGVYLMGVLSISAGVRVFAGSNHTCSVNTQGEARCWGANDNGQLGVGSTEDVFARPASAIAFGGAVVKTMALGSKFSCALLASNNVTCWGANNEGQLGLGDVTQRTMPPSSLINFGQGRSARAIAAGKSHVCAILDDLSLQCWGSPANGRLGLVGTTVNTKLPTTVVPANVVQVKAGEAHTCVIRDDKTVRCWGDGESGRLGNGSYSSVSLAASSTPVELGGTVKALALGSRHSCAISIGGKAMCWGSHLNGQLGIGSGELTYNEPQIVDLGGGHIAKSLALGDFHSCVVLGNNSVKCFGNNGSNQVHRVESNGSFNTPVAIAPTSGGVSIEASSIALGAAHTCVVEASDSAIVCWGSNDRGQLGTGSP